MLPLIHWAVTQLSWAIQIAGFPGTPSSDSWGFSFSPILLVHWFVWTALWDRAAGPNEGRRGGNYGATLSAKRARKSWSLTI